MAYAAPLVIPQYRPDVVFYLVTILLLILQSLRLILFSLGKS